MATPAPSSTPPPGSVLLLEPEGAGNPCWRLFRSPLRIVSASRLEEVPGALAAVEAAAGEGLFAAGFISYEAAPALDPALSAHPPGSLPLVWFGIYREPDILGEKTGTDGAPGVPGAAGVPRVEVDWVPSVTREEYSSAIHRIKSLIAEGETYQVNHTYRLRAPSPDPTWTFFRRLHRSQGGGFSAYLDTGRHLLCSVSPELFFRLDGDSILCRPMKGTAPRGRTVEEDDRLRRGLRESPKERAENLMVLDMVRSDLGRIARVGSVRVEGLFEVERHPTLFQMTSAVRADTSASFPEILSALFPSASVTGAPKARTMGIIRELEPEPRGIYTGCIGWLGPGRQGCFSVAIRTVWVDREAGRAEYGTGGGIVWDSEEEGEYRESLTKAEVLTRNPPPFLLLETLRWSPGRGYLLLERHLDRMQGSAGYFGFRFDREEAARALQEEAARLPPLVHRVRLLAGEGGGLRVEAVPFVPRPRRWKVAVARRSIDPGDRFLFHKTTWRRVYEEARADLPGFDDVLLWNPQGEVTEGTVANLVAHLGGEWVTPPLSCGLLGGVFRGELLRRGRVRERVVRLPELAGAEGLFLVNSLRGWIPVELQGPVSLPFPG